MTEAIRLTFLALFGLGLIGTLAGRHPGYSATIALWLGAAFGSANWVLLALWPLLVVVVLVTSRQEERMLVRKFPEDYHRYAHHTGRFVPKLSAASANNPKEDT